MPKEGISLYFTIQDNASSVLTSLGDKTKALDKETQSLAQAQEGLKRANEPLLRQQAELRTALDKLKSETKDAKKAWEQYGDELHEGIYTNLLEEQAELQEQLRNVNDQVKANQKTFREYQEDIRKGGLSDNGGGSLGGEESGSILTAIVGGQIGQMLSGSLGGAAQAFLTSAIGTPTANLASDAISSAIQGAALGTAIAPGIGTAIGAGAGALSGLISGGTQIYQQRDDTFKDYYNGLYESALTERERAVSSGTTLASTRESDLRALTTLLGSEEDAAEFQRALIEMGRTPPFSYDTVTSLSRNMIGLGLDTDEITDRINNLANAAAALDLSESNVSSIISYLESAELSEKLDTRVLRSLSKMGINAYEALADEFGMSQGDVAANLGNLDVERAISAIYSYMGRNFENAADSLANTFEGASGILDSFKEDMDAAAGARYNDLRTAGLQAEIDSYSGPLGDALKEISSLTGQNQAYLENLQERYNREALEAVLLGYGTTLFDDEAKASLSDLREQFAEAKSIYEEGGEKSQEAALKMQNLRDQAEIVAQNAYESSEAVKTLHDSQIDLIDATRDLSAKFDAWQWKYEVGVEQTKGLAAASVSGTTLTYAPNDAFSRAMSTYNAHAFGLERVPYDGYAAILHQDERVLTAQEARAQDEGERGDTYQITIPGANFYGTSRESADEIVELIAQGLERATAARGR